MASIKMVTYRCASCQQTDVRLYRENDRETLNPKYFYCAVCIPGLDPKKRAELLKGHIKNAGMWCPLIPVGSIDYPHTFAVAHTERGSCSLRYASDMNWWQRKKLSASCAC